MIKPFPRVPSRVRAPALRAELATGVEAVPRVTGRPLLVKGVPTSTPALRDRSSAWSDEALAPRLEGIGAEDRAALAASWSEDASKEHASVASFARFSIELMAAGAPPELTHLAHAAAEDELVHARVCIALASAYAGECVRPARLPVGATLAVTSDLAKIATSLVGEGCVGETLAAIVAAEQRDRAEDPAVRAVLSRIAEDEAAHAELAWRAVRWLVAEGGEAIHAAVREAFAHASIPEDRERAPRALAPHGRLDSETKRAVMANALTEVVMPCARSVLASPRATSGLTEVIMPCARSVLASLPAPRVVEKHPRTNVKGGS